MRNEIQIRTVTVELLRAGPAHNQLLSPLTPYLGVCDDAEAGVVILPFEHASFLRRMKSMRYTAGVDDEGHSDRLPVLRELGVDMAKLLGAIPRLPGALSADAGGPDTLVHLRLVLSASELASLPFEQAKLPIGPTAYSEGWLSLQARVPVVVTRRTRNVSEGGVTWPSKPRLLFVSADPAEVPFEQHRAALIEAVRPYLKPGQETPQVGDAPNRSQYGDLLTVLEDASFGQVIDECARNRYTHVHVLAHGAEDGALEDRRYGLALKGQGGAVDVISGERLASAFACLVDGAIHRPAVVVLATCDSANQADVVTPGASIAHVLHQAGIAMVVASQYPLSKEGSELLTRELYPGLLRGENPWLLMHRIRTGLHSRVMGHSHDWASLVVYEALPTHLADALEELQYAQSRLAINVALEGIDRAVNEAARGPKGPLAPGRVAAHKEAVRRATEWLPLHGRFITECLGLRASSKKRLAEAEFNIACHAAPADQPGHVRRSLVYLDQSLEDYRLAVDSILVSRPGQVAQRVASLHWVLVQQLCLSAVLGKKPPDGAWETARLSAEAHLELRDPDEHAWALGSLIELWLLKTVDPESCPSARRQSLDRALKHADQLVRMFSSPDPFPIQSTRMQLMRYARWWSHELVGAVIAQQYPDYPSWKTLGMVEAAQALIEALDGHSTLGRIVSADDSEPAAPAPTAALPGASVPAVPAVPADLLAARPKRSKRPAQPLARPPAPDAFLRIEMLPALHGDCLWIEYGDGTTLNRVLIDCGTAANFPRLKARIAALAPAERAFEMLILSHIDDDHIGGAIPLLQDRDLGTRFGNIWFNGWKHLRPDQPERLGAVQGEVFSGLIVKHGHPWNLWPERGADGGTIVVPTSGDLPTHTLPGGLRLTLLSPTPDKLVPLRKKWQKDVEAKGLVPGVAPPERLGRRVSKSTDVFALAERDFDDDTPHNGSSIAVLAEYGGKTALLGADAHWPVLLATVRRHLALAGTERLRLDAFKVPHHGSRNNLSNELLKLLDCRNHLVSTNGQRFKHPDREAVAKLIVHGGPQARLHFNYRSPLNAVWADPALQDKYGYTARYPEPEAGADTDTGLRVPL